MDKITETAVLAGGCFWGMQDLFRKQPGVIDTCVGYIGGTTGTANYDQVKMGSTGHAEALEIVFDPSITDFQRILNFFFQIHDPTTVNRQGNDRGTQYRSAIFYQNQTQHDVATKTIHRINRSGKWPGPVVTTLETGVFYAAEAAHQDYLERYPHGYTCHFIRPDWKMD